METLAAAPETNLGGLLARIIEEEQAERRIEYRKRPKIGGTDMRQDIRWKMGACEEGLSFIIDLMQEAQKELERQRKKER